MNATEFIEQKERIKALADAWVGPQEVLAGWVISFEFVQHAGLFMVDGVYQPHTVAACKADWRYMEATISWNLPNVVDLSDGKLEDILVHEMMHIFLNELRGLLPEDGRMSLERDDWLAHEERAATTLAKAFRAIRHYAREEVTE